MGEAKVRKEHPLISVLIPERGRPAELDRCISSIIDTAGDDQRYEIVVYIDNDDPAWIDREPIAHSRTRYLRRERPPTLGEKLNILAREAAGDIFFWLGNDTTIETHGWPERFREVCAKLPNGIGVPHVKDPFHPDHAAYWLMTRKMRDALGIFAVPFHPFWFCDTAQTELADLLGLRFEIDVTLGNPDGRGKTHGLVDLAFWTEFFNVCRALRVRDAVNMAKIAWGEGSPEFQKFQAELGQRHQLCINRVAHLSSPMFLERWGDTAASPPSADYPKVKAHAEQLMQQIKEQTPRKIRVGLAVPSTRAWEGTMATAFAAMAAHSALQGIEIAVINVQSSDVCHGRNATVEISIQNRCDFTLFVDSDMKFPPDLLVRLLSHQKDVVGALYPKRVKNAQGEYDILGKLKGPRPEKLEGDLHEALLMPGGIMLIKNSVFETIKWPYFAQAFRWPGDDGLAAFKTMMREYVFESPSDDVLASIDDTKFGQWLRDGGYTLGEFGEFVPSFSEDLFFTRKCRKFNISCWADLRLTNEISHLGEIPITASIDLNTVRLPFAENSLPEAAD